MKIIIGIFFIFHGLVHVFYGLHSLRTMELTPGLEWPANAWTFSKWMKKKSIRLLAALLVFLTAALLVFSGIYFLVTGKSPNAVLWSACGISTITFLFFWDGKFKKVDHQGFYGIVINAAIFLLTCMMFP